MGGERERGRDGGGMGGGRENENERERGKSESGVTKNYQVLTTMDLSLILMLTH